MAAKPAVTHRLVGVVVLLATLGALLMSWRATSHLTEYVECQAEWSQAYASTSGERAKAADQDRQALDNMIAAVTESQTRAETRRALVIYQQIRAEADDARTRNPLPELPNVCH